MRSLFVPRLPSIALLTFTFLFSVDPLTDLHTRAQNRSSQRAQLKQILREPTPAEDQTTGRDDLARAKAKAAVELMMLGDAASVWPLLRHSPDPSVRTYLIHDLASMGADPRSIIARLKIESDVSVRRALILSLGEFGDEQLPVNLRRPVINLLLRWYRNDPDPGIHSAIDWLLRYPNQGKSPRKLAWDMAEALTKIDHDLVGRPAMARDWYVSREGHTMMIVRSPAEFRMGSPSFESGRMPASDSPDEDLHRARIPRSFTIASKEVTVSQFQRFLDANPSAKRGFTFSNDASRMSRMLQTFSPENDGPQIALTWYEAAMYCNWLSQQEGIPKSEWVYPIDPGLIKDSMQMPVNYLHRTGYRLPTEAEWEYAARAGSVTARFYGAGETMLQSYAWYSKNPPKKKGDPVDPTDPQRTWPIGQLKPNDFGLFDMLGNVWEWCQDRMREPGASNAVTDDREDDVLLVADREARSRRGGAFPYEAAAQRSAGRGTRNAFPMLRRDNVGFRVARTFR